MTKIMSKCKKGRKEEEKTGNTVFRSKNETKCHVHRGYLLNCKILGQNKEGFRKEFEPGHFAQKAKIKLQIGFWKAEVGSE